MAHMYANGNQQRTLIHAEAVVVQVIKILWCFFFCFNFILFFSLYQATCLACQMQPLPSAQLVIGNCQSLDTVEREHCTGYCSASSENNSLVIGADGTLIIEPACQQCKPSSTYNQTITLECTNNGVTTQYNAVYVRIQSCSCSGL